MNAVPRATGQHSGIKVAIVADDLTGAADCAAAFAAAGRRPWVLLEPSGTPRTAPDGCDVIALSANSRDVGPRAGGEAMAAAVRELAAISPHIWFKKIDSTLRGHLSLEFQIVTELVDPEVTLVCPAFPRAGRILRRGRTHVHGTPLEQTPLWQKAGGGSAHLPTMLAFGDRPPSSIGISELRSGELTESLHTVAHGGVLVVDAETDRDLDAIVRLGLESGRGILWVGSAGLAGALASALGPAADDVFDHGVPPDGDERSQCGTVLVVVGSGSEQSQRQLAELRRSCDAEIVILPVVGLLGREPAMRETALELVEAALVSHRDAVVAIEPIGSIWPNTIHSELAGRVGEMVGAVAGHFAALVLTGGDTARAVLQATGVTGLRVLGNVEDGIPMSRATPTGQRVVTKAGAFGDDHSLSRAVQLLHAEPGGRS